MQTEIQTLTIKHWNQLTREQLQYVLTEQNRVKIYLYLMGLRIETDNILPDFGNSEDMTMEEYGEWLDTFGDLLNGKKIALRDSEGALFYSTPKDLAYASMKQLEWMETDHTLLIIPAFPMERLKIGKHYYKMPDALLANNTYQQYSNSQAYMQQYWQLLERIIPPNEDEAKRKKRKPWTPPTEEEVKKIMLQILEARKGFMASILTPYRYKVKPRWPFIFYEPLWEASSEKEMIADMARAPEWLFDALYKLWQDNLEIFRKKFPDVFTQSKGDPKYDSYVAELGTVNLVNEKGGYGSAAAVYDENCGFVIKIINDQVKEAKELERINKESKAKR